MITRQFISELTTKLQTTEENIAREYYQHLFLSYFYKKEGAEKIVFKGGTALRIIFDSPRFSEDLDFSASNNGEIKIQKINQLIDSTIDDFRKEGIKVKKEVNPGTQGETSGGYFAIIKVEMLGFNSEIKIQISFRSPEKVKGNTTLIQNDFISPYVIHYLTESILISEKTEALLERKKNRDFFDLYFILRDSRLVKFMPHIPNLKKRLLEIAPQQGTLESGLKVFLPISYHQLLKKFLEHLYKEVEDHISN